MQGLHLTADLRDCAGDGIALRDAETLRRCCREAALGAGLSVVGELFHPFPAPGGVTGVVLLAESHLAVHTWPELGTVTIDVYVCNREADHSGAAEAVLTALEAVFRPARVERHRIQRGAVA
jgi:S-adenosylmethionine decarboxylase